MNNVVQEILAATAITVPLLTGFDKSGRAGRCDLANEGGEL